MLSRGLLLAAAILMLAACAGTGNVKSDSASQATLKQRVEQRWAYLVDREAAKAWDYLTPGYRATITRQEYAGRMNHRPINWTSANLTKLECPTASKCTAYVMVNIKLMVPGIGPSASFSPLKETWLLLDNQWYYLPAKHGAGL